MRIKNVHYYYYYYYYYISRPLDEVVNEQMELKLGDPRSLEHY